MRLFSLMTLSPLAATLALGCDSPSGSSNPTPDTTDDTTGQEVTPDATPDVPPAPECESNAECADKVGRPICNLATTTCEALPGGYLIGTGDGTVGSVNLVELYRPAQRIESTDLAFHPERDELWVVNRRFEVQGVCAQSNPGSARCRSLGSTTTILYEPGTPTQRASTLEDLNSWHFMRRAPALAMGALDTFATCGEASTGNFEDDPVTYIGPSLWSSDPEIYAVRDPSFDNGSHLDMLHETPWCMGIAHERDNVYWLFNGDAGSIDRVNFNEPHEPGGDDHSDGEVHRYAKGLVTRAPNIPSHMVFNAADSHLYIVDSGSARLLKLDTTSGTPGGRISPIYEQLRSSGEFDNATLTVLVDQGLVEPSGLALHEGTLYVSDHKTSKIHAFDLAGTPLRTLETGLPEGTLAGIEVGPDNRLYFTDMLNGAVYRIDWQ
jgi:hypothetical protein